MAQQAEYMLTTVDNPFNPHTQFDAWFAYDRLLGHGTCELLARITHSASGLSEADQQLAITLAIDEIVNENVNGLFKKVEPPSS